VGIPAAEYWIAVLSSFLPSAQNHLFHVNIGRHQPAFNHV